MERKCVFSIFVVLMLAVLSAAAFVSSLPGMQADKTSVKGAEPKAMSVVSTEKVYLFEKDILEDPPRYKLAKVTSRPVTASMNLDVEDIYLLTKIAMAEAEGEDTEGKALVILTVLNRIGDDEFPDTVGEVIYQPGQFSSVSDGRFALSEPDADCWAALDLIMKGKWDESCGATYFESKSESVWHSENLTFLFQHGKHYFYIDREVKSG